MANNEKFNELCENKEYEAAFDLFSKMEFSKMADINGDGKISKDEFIRIMSKSLKGRLSLLIKV